MAWKTAHAVRSLRNWSEALKMFLNQCPPNRSLAPANSLATATSAPSGPAAKVRPRWAKIEADQWLSRPREGADRRRGEHEGGAGPEGEERGVGGLPHRQRGGGHRSGGQRRDVGDQGRRVGERAGSGLRRQAGDAGGEATVPARTPPRAGADRCRCHGSPRLAGPDVRPAVSEPLRPWPPARRPRGRSGRAPDGAPW